MNHRFEINRKLFWDLVIIKKNAEIIYSIYYYQDFIHHHVRVHLDNPEIIEYLVSNNICILEKDKYDKNVVKLVFTDHILLELI